MLHSPPPSFDIFEKHFQAGKTQLLWTWIPGDLETPVSAYLKLCTGKRPSFLLESIEGGTTLGRYSVIGFDSDLNWRCHNMKAETKRTGKRWNPEKDLPLQSLKKMIANCKIDVFPAGLPPMAVSGLFGYMGYGMAQLAENLPDTNPDALDLEDSHLVRPRMLVIFDNVKNMICLVRPVYEHRGNTEASALKIHKNASKKLQEAIEALDRPIRKKILDTKSALSLPLNVKANMNKNDYTAAVRKAVDYIYEGDIFQVVLGQRFTADFDLPAIALYRSLRALNPSPFMVHMEFEDFALVASSPEILVRVRDQTVTIRPIAGTRKRGKTQQEDKALEKELLADEKERAEHLMLLDLGRNDVGRVAEYGSVEVTEKFSIERYSHVMHIVSNVEGRLREDLDIIDAHFAGFPAGTVSGAPKIRAMEIIDELETTRRSYYGGSIGYFSGNGTMDTCIALRTALIKNGKIHVQAGAGIVADSNPESEYQETVNKARALIQAAEAAIARAQEAPPC